MLYFKIKNDKRVYTLGPEDSECANPAKYSTEDKFSEEIIKMKKRYKIFQFDN